MTDQMAGTTSFPLAEVKSRPPFEIEQVDVEQDWSNGSNKFKPNHRDNRSMYMAGIFSRTRDIIAANVTDMLDKAQDPSKMIRMIILEMEETLVEVRASAARTIADQKEMRDAPRVGRRHREIAEKAAGSPLAAEQPGQPAGKR